VECSDLARCAASDLGPQLSGSGASHTYRFSWSSLHTLRCRLGITLIMRFAVSMRLPLARPPVENTQISMPGDPINKDTTKAATEVVLPHRRGVLIARKRPTRSMLCISITRAALSSHSSLYTAGITASFMLSKNIS
jgi:hypothetical protein